MLTQDRFAQSCTAILLARRETSVQPFGHGVEEDFLADGRVPGGAAPLRCASHLEPDHPLRSPPRLNL